VEGLVAAHGVKPYRSPALRRLRAPAGRLGASEVDLQTKLFEEHPSDSKSPIFASSAPTALVSAKTGSPSAR
jgi:hypothetical protein